MSTDKVTVMVGDLVEGGEVIIDRGYGPQIFRVNKVDHNGETSTASITLATEEQPCGYWPLTDDSVHRIDKQQLSAHINVNWKVLSATTGYDNQWNVTGQELILAAVTELGK